LRQAGKEPKPMSSSLKKIALAYERASETIYDYLDMVSSGGFSAAKCESCFSALYRLRERYETEVKKKGLRKSELFELKDAFEKNPITKGIGNLRTLVDHVEDRHSKSEGFIEFSDESGETIYIDANSSAFAVIDSGDTLQVDIFHEYNLSYDRPFRFSENFRRALSIYGHAIKSAKNST
jgi:hypothetical protein